MKKDRPYNKDRRPAGRSAGHGDRPYGRSNDRNDRGSGRSDHGKPGKPYQSGDRADNRDRKPFKSDNKDRKPFRTGEKDYKPHKKPYDKKPYDRDKKPFDKDAKPYNKDRGPPRERAYTKAPAAPRLRASRWGAHAVKEAWLNPARTIKNFYATEQALKGFLETYEAAKARGLDRPMPVITDKADFDRSFPNAVHQGLALDADPLDEVFIQDLISATIHKEDAVVLILDQVTDPHNVGAIMRSASAFGAQGIVMQTRHAPEITAVLAKSACGAVEHVPVAYETNLSRALVQLKEAGFRAVGLDERGPKTLAQTDLSGKIVLVLGAEGAGLRPSLAEQCDTLTRLPTQGAILSLNVSNAAAVALYELAREG